MQTVVRGGRSGNPNGATLEEIINRCGFWIKCPIYDLLTKELKSENLIEESSFKPSDEEMVMTFLKENESFFTEDADTPNLFRCAEQISKKLMQAEEVEL